MTQKVIHSSVRVYGFLLNLYPQDYRQEFAQEMKYVFGQLLKDTYKKEGSIGVMNLWTRTIIDASKSLVVQHLENYQRRDTMKTKSTDIIGQNKIFLWIGLVTGVLLSIPVLGQFPWDITDFLVMGALLFGAGTIFVFIARVTPRKYRVFIGMAILALFLWIWAELAVGLFTNWGS